MKFDKNIDCSKCEFKCDVYRSISDKHFDFNLLKPVYVQYKKHEYICKQGSLVTHAIYLLRGSAKLYIEGLNNRNISLYILTPQSYIGLLSFFETPLYSYSVKVLEDTQVCMIDLNFVKDLYIKNHEFLLNLNKAFGKSVSSIMGKIITLNQKNIRGRLADTLLYLSSLYNSDNFEMLLTRKDLGELSAISEENAVRLLAEFKRENIICVTGKQISIIDKNLLKKISDLG